MIKFNCPNCGQKLRVPEDCAGRKGKCPKCKNAILIPASQIVADLLTPAPQAIEQPPEKPPYNLTFLDNPRNLTPPTKPPHQYSEPDTAGQDQNMLLRGYRKPEPDTPPTRKLPWPIDMLLYPISKPCLMTLSIVFIIPVLLDILRVMVGPFWMFVHFPGLVVRIVIGLYFYWYIAECIRDSATGGIRGPETIGNAPSAGDMFWQMVRIVGCLAFFLLPLLIYYIRTRQTDTVFWALLGYAAFFFPMGLLAILMFDSFSGLNPIIIIGSIFSTFFQYVALAAVFGLVGYLFVMAGRLGQDSFFLPILLFLARIDLILVSAHLLGRFFFKYQEKLNWEV
jgi:hypothetical protein